MRTDLSRRLLFAVFSLSVSALGCASGSGGAAAGGAGCELTGADSALLAGGPVYRDCAVDRRARLIPSSVVLDYRPSSRPASGARCHYVMVELMVDTRGLPETATTRMVSSTEPQLGKAVMESVPGWRFEPAQKAGVAVRQIVRERREFALATVVVVTRAGTPPTPPPPSARPRC